MDAGLDAVDRLLTGGLNKVILWVLLRSSFFVVAEMVGLLPRKLSGWINRNRMRETMRLLREFGVDTETPRRANGVARLEQIKGQDLAERVNGRLATTKINHPVMIGTQVEVRAENYIDLMGATSDLNLARVYARDLSGLWRSLADVGGQVANTNIDFIVAPKAGSPLLASCFAELLRKPLLLHNQEPKFRSDPNDPKALFDCQELPAPGSQGLMVDDSSTGGGKAVKLIDDLRRCGWNVSDFLVVFGPQLKAVSGQNAAVRLRPMGVTLHSIVKSHA
jgi:orotate phosphoribosyltransferase